MSKKKPKLYGLRKYWPSLTEAEAEDRRDKMFIAQEGKCGLCKKPESSFKRRLNVDHNHKTGQVRGLLCYRCNKYVIGRLNYETACKIVEYLSVENIPKTQTIDSGPTLTFEVDGTEGNEGC